jgi:hypothetical protein
MPGAGHAASCLSPVRLLAVAANAEAAHSFPSPSTMSTPGWAQREADKDKVRKQLVAARYALAPGQAGLDLSCPEVAVAPRFDPAFLADEQAAAKLPVLKARLVQYQVGRAAAVSLKLPASHRPSSGARSGPGSPGRRMTWTSAPATASQARPLTGHSHRPAAGGRVSPLAGRTRPNSGSGKRPRRPGRQPWRTTLRRQAPR